jgi:hypothetical protein
MQELREILTALWPLQKPNPDWGFGVFLNVEDADEMKELTEGQHVKLAEPPELVVEDAVLHKIKVDDGRVFWFAEIGEEDAIQVLAT